MEDIRKEIKRYDYKSLGEIISEEYKITIEKIEANLKKLKPDLSEKYNGLVERIKNEKLEYEEFIRIIKEVDMLLEEVKNIKEL